MGERQEYEHALRQILAGSSDGTCCVEDFLIANSGLPGPRGNLELAAAFADCYVGGTPEPWELEMLGEWANISAQGEMRLSDLLEIIHSWERVPSFLELRALAATLAHPPLLRDPQIAGLALCFADAAPCRIEGACEDESRTAEFKILKQGLEYALSVYVAALPENGSDMLDRWAVSPSKRVRQIIKANLGKSRLSRFPERVSRTLALVSGGQ